jgi:hypothetical protein
MASDVPPFDKKKKPAKGKMPFPPASKAGGPAPDKGGKKPNPFAKKGA